MKPAFFSLTVIVQILFSGCSTLSGQSPRAIALLDVERFQSMKSIDINHLQSQFGAPDQVVPLSIEEEVWVYSDREAKEPVQKASFLIDKKSGMVRNGTWVPGQSDDVHQKENALKHFKRASFSVRDIGLVAGHEYSDEATYNDSANGISLRVNKASETVSAISFDMGKSSALAKQP